MEQRKKKGALFVRLDDKIKEALANSARVLGLSECELVRFLITKHLKHNQLIDK